MAPVKRLAAAAAALALACSREPAPAPPAPAAPTPRPVRPDRGAVPEAPAPELTSAAFRRFADRRAKEVRRCYDAALQGNPALRGRIELRFSVLPSGAISDVEVASTSFRDRAIPACVAEVFRTWRTPFRPEEPVGIEYPLSFSPQR
jgi:hypothetical protein